MKKRIVSLVLLTAMAMPIVQPIMTEYSPVSYASEETGAQEEYTSELNPVKPSEAADDYVIKFRDDNLKKILLSAMRKNENDEIKVSDAKNFSRKLQYNSQSEKSLEGLQYFKKLTNLEVTDGDGINSEMFTPIKDISLSTLTLNNNNLDTIPKIEHFKDIKILKLEDNNITSLEGIDMYSDIQALFMKNNKISDISGVENIGQHAVTIDLSFNRISDISMLAGKADSFPKLLTFKLNGNMITDFSSFKDYELRGIYQGVQDILKITDDGTFELPIVEYYDERADTPSGRIYGIRNLELDVSETSEVSKIGENKYAVKDPKSYIATSYYKESSYNLKKGEMFNCKVTTINKSQINSAIEKFKEDKTEENLNKLKDILYDLNQIKSYSINNAIVNSLVADIERKLNVSEKDIDEYTSIYNPIKPSEAQDSQIVNIPDPVFKEVVQKYVKIWTGASEVKEEITVGDMRKIESIFDIYQVNEPTRINAFNSIEGIQYAENLKQIHLTLLKDSKLEELTDGGRKSLKQLTEDEIAELTEYPTGRIDPLIGLTNLKYLAIDAWINSLDLNTLKNLTDLEVLVLGGNPITDIDSIKHLKNLTDLKIASSLIKNADPLSVLSNLKSLDLGGNLLGKNMGIAFLKNAKFIDVMETLSLGSNHISDISEFPYMKNLKTLSFVQNDISDITVFNQYEDINQLRLGDNLITDISSLKNMDFSNAPYSKSVYRQYTEAIVDENGKFEFISKDKNGDEVQIDIKSNDDIKRISEYKYELTDKTLYSLDRKFNVGSGNNSSRGSLWGTVRIINRPRILKLVSEAEKDPTQANINRALDAVEHLRNTKISKELFEESQELKAKLEALKPEASAESVSLNKSKLTLTAGEKEKLTATVKPDNATNKEVIWSSSDDSIAKVDSKGNVEAVAEGKATITATVKGTDIKATAEVTVEPVEEEVKAESIELDAVKIDMYKGQKDKIKATVKPVKAVNKEVEWSSSDDSIVKVDADGNIEAVGVGTATITAKVKGTDITASVEVVSSEVTAPIDSKFTDINGHWAKAYIEHSAERGLFKGTTETLFSPEMNMTRGMFVTVLGRLAEETAEPNDKFADVNREAYYAEYIAWAEENGIVEGYGNGNFGPDNNVTREEMAAIIERYMKYKGIELEDNGAAAFADADSISDWAKESVTKIQKAGIIEGKGNGVFDPQTNSTRAEVATLLIRMIEKYID